MKNSYYLDTAIWLDFIEERDEPKIPKGKWASDLIKKVVKNNKKIIYSDVNIYELNVIGYSVYDIDKIFKPLKSILIFVESTEKQVRKARDLSLRRKIPNRDALHALIARDHSAILVTLDHHFKKMLDIIEPKKPQDII